MAVKSFMSIAFQNTLFRNSLIKFQEKFNYISTQPDADFGKEKPQVHVIIIRE